MILLVLDERPETFLGDFVELDCLCDHALRIDFAYFITCQ